MVLSIEPTWTGQMLNDCPTQLEGQTVTKIIPNFQKYKKIHNFVLLQD